MLLTMTHPCPSNHETSDDSSYLQLCPIDHSSLKWLFVLHEIENKSISCSFDKNYIDKIIQITEKSIYEESVPCQPKNQHCLGYQTR